MIAIEWLPWALVGMFAFASVLLAWRLFRIRKYAAHEREAREAAVAALHRGNAIISRQKGLMETILREVPGYFAWFDDKARCMGANEAMLEFLRQDSIESVLGKGGEQLLLPGRVRELLSSPLVNGASENGGGQTEELVSMIDGEQRILAVHVRTIEAQDGGPRGRLLMLLDKTREREKEDLLREAMAQAESATQTQSIFIAGMSHEIRTPLTSICGLSQLLAQTSLSERQANYVRMMEGSASNLLRLINDVLDFARFQAGKLHLKAEPCVIADIIQEAAGAFSREAAQKGLKWELHATGLNQPLLVDQLRLKQVLVNLLSNAIKFTTDGTITLGAAATEDAPGMIRLHIYVEDTGIGISHENRKSIFEPFYQVDSALNRRFSGTGLGLSICRMIIQSMGSELKVQSQVGKGSRFEFILFLNAAPHHGMVTPRESVPQVSRARGMARQANVLLVEDDPFSRFVIAEMLTSLGAVVTMVEDGDQALEKAQAESYDLYLVDLLLPRMDGLALTKKLRELHTFTGCPAMALITADNDPALKRDCELAGLEVYLAKPPAMEDLRRLLHSPSTPQTPHCSSKLEARLREFLPVTDFDHALLLKHIAWRTGREDELLHDLAQLLITEHARYVIELTAAAAREDWREVGEISHKLRNAAQTLGACRLLGACERYEQALKQSKPEGLGPLVQEMLDRLEQVVACLRAL